MNRLSNRLFRNFCIKIDPNNSVHEYLKKLGYDDNIISSILRAFPNQKPSFQDIKILGPSGLKELVKAIVHEDTMIKTNNIANTKKNAIQVNISIPKHKTSFQVTAFEGETFFDLAKRDEEIKSYLECSCGGIAACSTCHVIVNEEFYALLPPAEESELDMVDLAWGVTPTSRLGCQLKFTKSLDGLKVVIPEQSNDLYYAP